MGYRVVLTELDALRVDQDQADLVWCRAHQQRRDDAVDAARLARTGLARDEHVRERGEIGENRAARDIAAHRDVERVVRPLGVVGKDVAERHERPALVRHLDADGAAPGNGRKQADVVARHRVRDLLGETRHLVDLDARRELELVPGDGGADGSADEAGVDTELTQRRFEHFAAGRDHAGVGLARLAALEQRQRRQLPRDFRQFLAVAARVRRLDVAVCFLFSELDRGLGFCVRGVGGRDVDHLELRFGLGRDEVERRRIVVGNLVVEPRPVGFVGVVECRRRQRQQGLRLLDHVRDHERHHVRDLAQAAPDDEQNSEHAERHQHDDRAGRTEHGRERRGDECADDAARAPERVE
jgi:hypothetical protein